MNSRLLDLVADSTIAQRVDSAWSEVGRLYEHFDKLNINPTMARRELSFHDQVKLLAFVAIEVESVLGDFLEIGVWKGKSLALLNAFCQHPKRVLGVDPFRLPGQFDEFSYFHKRIFSEAEVIRGFSEQSFHEVLKFSDGYSLIHIDGGHSFNNVITDFLLYGRLLCPGGIIVFDDYGDFKHSPDVKPAVDHIVSSGWANEYDVIGQLPGYKNPFLLRRPISDSTF